MRLILVAGLSLLSVVARAEQRPMPGGDVSAKTLSAKDVDAYLVPYVEGIRSCYLARGKPPATRHMRVELIIHRDGSVFRLRVVAPKLARASARIVEACIQKASKEWHFPPRSGFTHVAIPFFFHRADPKGAGPFPGCYSPRGCPESNNPATPSTKEQQP